MDDTTEKRERGMNRVWSKVQTKHVIWFLLCAVFGLILFMGGLYGERLEAVENHIETQNGTLHRMDVEQQMQRVDIGWIIESMGGEPKPRPKPK